MNNQLFTRDLVCLAPLDAAQDAPIEARWRNDPVFIRAFGDTYVRPQSVAEVKKHNETIEKEADENGDDFHFGVRTCDADRFVGFARLEGVDWSHGAARIRIGIGIGDRSFWGQGYGTEAVRLLLQYAFGELNLYRISLNVFAYNERAIRAYQKAGFKIEGRARGAVKRDGKRWDLVFMGILRPD